MILRLKSRPEYIFICGNDGEYFNYMQDIVYEQHKYHTIIPFCIENVVNT